MGRCATAIVVGAGVAGATTALALRREGLEVTLVDAWEPGHAAAASSGEHRIVRFSHGTDEVYTQLSREGRLGWLELGEQTGQELFVQSGAVMLAREGDTSWEDASRKTLSRMGIPHFIAPAEELAVRLPVMDARGLAYGLWEPDAGFVYAKRGVLAAIRQFRREGGTISRGRVRTDRDEYPMLDGKRLDADVVVMAAGAWMADLFPRTLRRMIEVVRQNVIMVAPPAGETSYDHTDFPCWVDHGSDAYGIPAAGGYGFKAVLVGRQLAIDLDHDDRIVDATSVASTRRYLSTRFPDLADRPITHMGVGQFANTADTHFIIDHHPDHSDLTVVAGDSGHLFKHGPALGRYVAAIAVGNRDTDDRFRIKDRSSVPQADRPQ